MGEVAVERDAVLIWFIRQRRSWWKTNRWKWVLTGFLIPGASLAYPMILAAIMSSRSNMSFSHALSQINPPIWGFLPLAYLVVVLVSVWQVSSLGSSYKVPAELLVAITPKNCTRAFHQILRRDVYLVYGLLNVVITVFFVAQLIMGNETAWHIMGFICYMIMALICIAETTVVLHSFKRDMNQVIYAIVPGILLLLQGLAPYAVAAILHLITRKDFEQQYGFIAVLWGIALLVFAFILHRLPAVRKAMNSVWVEE